MTTEPLLWLRAETRADEHRTPLTPPDAGTLIRHGVRVVVEQSPQRIYPITQYAAAGCTVSPAGRWPDAPESAYVLGLKELPDDPAELRHRHIYFSHSYKGQPGSEALLARFARGGGEILDLEYLVDESGRRLAAFGYWAGYVGAALGVLHLRKRLAPLTPTSRAALDRRLAEDSRNDQRALVIGALGRCGTGARDALSAAGMTATAWDLAETRDLDRPGLLGHDLLVNAVLTTGPTDPFVVPDDLARPGRTLAVIADVTCDVGSPHHVLPVYDQTTSWSAPARRVTRPDQAALDVIAIDNLPSLLPREASDAFSADLTPHLLTLDHPGSRWTACRHRFLDHVVSEVTR